MDSVTLLEKATEQMSQVMKGVDASKLTESTPCADFDVKALLGHIFGGTSMMIAAAQTGKAAMPSGEFEVPADPAKTYDEMRKQMLDAFRAPGVLEKTLEMPFGAMPGAMVAGICFTEHYIHSWDLAKATGQSTAFDADLAEESYKFLKPLGPMLRGPGVFGPEVEVPESAPVVDRLMGFVGRKP